MKKKGDVTRERIITEATQLINRKGIGATSVNDLVTAAGVKKGCLYFHFPGKDDLGISVLDRARERFVRFLDDSLAGETPGACLRGFFSNVFLAHSQTGFVGGCIFGNTALEVSDSDTRYARLVGSVFDEWVSRLAETIALAQATREVRGDVAPEALARLVVSTIEGGIMLSRLGKDARPLMECLGSLELLLGLKARG